MESFKAKLKMKTLSLNRSSEWQSLLGKRTESGVRGHGLKASFCLVYGFVMRDIKRYVNANRMIQNSMKGEITGTSRVGERG